MPKVKKQSAKTKRLIQKARRAENILNQSKDSSIALKNNASEQGTNRTQIEETCVCKNTNKRKQTATDNKLTPKKKPKLTKDSSNGIQDKVPIVCSIKDTLKKIEIPKNQQIDTNKKELKKTNVEYDVEMVSKDNSTIPILLHKPTPFELAIREGPTVACSCCLRLWFPSICKTINIQRLEEKFGSQFIQKIVNNGYNFCGSCLTNLYKGKLPKFWCGNYNMVHAVPEELKGLSILEERMVSPRIPFMQIREVGYARQCYITGQIVNVPVNINTSTTLLPRHLDETQTIQIQLKRKLDYKNAYLFETVRPNIILKAAEYLCKQPLYQPEGIKLCVSNDWEQNIEDFIRTQSDLCKVNKTSEILNIDIEKMNVDGEDTSSTNVFEPARIQNNLNEKRNIYDLTEFLEDDEPVNPGGQETLLDKCNSENICFAPGEGKTPLHLMMDKYSDELSFPSLFCGYAKECFVNFSYSDEVKLLLQHMDRRFARTDFLLYAFKKCQLIQLTNAVYTALRKKKNEKGTYTVGQVRQTNFIEQLIRNDQGFHFLSKVKNSPAYWKQEKTKLLCMIRQFGIPTLFFTISAAETAWPELIAILAKVVDNKELNLEEASNLPYIEKTRLIRKDPVTCARYFDHRFKLLFKHMKSANGPFKMNPIEHHYYRVEFQHRGSPHVHGLLWLSNAPKLSVTPESFKECADFANKYITCQSDLESVRDIIQFNTHHHSKSCQKDVKGYKVCRYHIPYLPMDESIILMPINIDRVKEPELRKAMSEKYFTIMTKLNAKPELSFEHFLADLGMSKEEYINIIQHNIFKPTLFLKRQPKDGFINNFNEEIFSMMKSNMDIQLVYEPYGCCSYIVGYINKSSRGVSDLLMKTMEEIKKGNLDIKSKLKTLAAAFLNASEVSAQEAAYSVLQLHMYDTSTSYIYIPTSPIMERTKMLKSLEELNQMDSDDTNIYQEGLIEHYEARPDEMENICLAEFAAYYDFFKKEASTKINGLPLKGRSGVLVRRKCAKIISYRRYGLQQDPKNYYREQIMLYLPWRNEVDEIEQDSIDQQTIYEDRFEELAANRKKFNVLDEKTIDDALKLAEEKSDSLVHKGFDGEIDGEFGVYGLDKPAYDPFSCIGEDDDSPAKHIVFPTPHQITDLEYDSLIRKLNHKQYQFLNIVQDNIIEGKTFYCTLSGSAGTGKSHLITAITQSLLRHFNSIPGNNPTSLKVLLCAPTGKAAFNIGGITLHSALSLPISQYGEELVPLSHDVVNTIYCNLCDLKLIIIDEYSMVGARMFDHINSRLQQIFKSDAVFGNIPIIMCGDIRQLPPVMDVFIFLPVKSNPYKQLCGTYLWDHFKYFELTEIMRQSEDKAFAVALNNMALGKMTNEDIELIRSREIHTDLIPENAMHLFATNKEVDAFNEKKLSTYKTERAVSEARDIIKGSCSDRLKQLFMEHAKGLKKEESFGLMLTLILQIDAKYMISMNIDTSDGIVNGATGILRQIDYNQNQIPYRVWIEFFDDKSGKECRNKAQSLMKSKHIPSTWTPIEKAARAIKIKKGSNVHVERLQFPLLISEGITIHKSQGATYEQVAIHISSRMTRSSTYVACSRATKLSGLYIVGNFKAPKPPNEDNAAFKELVSMQTNKLITSKYDTQFIKDSNVKCIIAYHNVQSFSKNISLISNNPIFKDAHILIFVETWLHKNKQNLKLNNFEIFANLINDQSVSKPFGIICYKKLDIPVEIKLVKKYVKNFSGILFQAISFFLNDINVIAVYIPPKLTVIEAKICLDEILIGQQGDILIIGDFNKDIINNCDNGLKHCLISKGLTSKLDIVTINQ
ncbi:uncharacterized protein LOC126741439 [Anthonomus grandis grandis]|uniref:uncharacterized protein LOC126741439 n=1 Tax=Anthonomus grandis grandis TaxID=2921223 RepID=UPI002165B5A5|nr:uncharacterized protein LOC126741439 [Anthonomus grandis grandis]